MPQETISREEFIRRYGQQPAVMDIEEWNKKYGQQPTATPAEAASAPTPAGPMATFLHRSGLAGLAEFGKGAIKELGSRFQGLSAPTTMGMVQIPSLTPQQTAPTNPAQALGQSAERTAEFFLPGGLTSKAGKGSSVLRNILARSGAEAAGAGAIAAGQSRDLGEAGTAAAIAGAIPLAGAAIAPAADVVKTFLSQKLPRRLVDSIIKPPQRQLRFGRNPGYEIASLGLKANNLEGLGAEIVKKSDEVGATINTKLSVPSVAVRRVDIVPDVVKPIDDAIRQAKIDGNGGLVARLEEFKKGQFMERFKLPAIPTRLELPPLATNKLKTEIGKSVRWTEDPIEGSLNDVKMQIYRNLNDSVGAKVPGVRDDMRSYANLLSAEKSVQHRIEAFNRLNLIGLTSAGIGAATAIATALADGSIPETAINGLLAGSLVRGTRSTRAITGLAAQLAKLQPQERTALAKLVPTLRNIYLGTEWSEMKNAYSGARSQ